MRENCNKKFSQDFFWFISWNISKCREKIVKNFSIDKGCCCFFFFIRYVPAKHLCSTFPLSLFLSGSADTHIFFSLPICASLFGCSSRRRRRGRSLSRCKSRMCICVCLCVCVCMCLYVCFCVCLRVLLWWALLIILAAHRCYFCCGSCCCCRTATCKMGVQQCPAPPPTQYDPLCGATKRIIKKCLMK